MPKADEPDGRRVRGHENRRKIIEAMLGLIGEGAISPSAEDVAARAAVGLRTVFRHFDDMDSLYRELSELMGAELMPIATAPLPDGDWRERLTEIVERRARVFERMMPFKAAADVHRHRSAFLRNEHAQLAEMQRTMLRQALPMNLRSGGTTFEALDLLTCFDSWRRLRQDQNLSVAQAKKTILAAATALLEGESR
jgi:AcrR family transcriptional regulator